MLTVGAIFSDHMVLQKGKRIPVWGTAEPGETVTASLAGRRAETKTLADGSFRLYFEPLEAGRSYVLAVRTSCEEVVFTDVAIGEVWLAGGQSNMELELINSADGEKSVAESGNPDLRFYMVPKYAVVGPELSEAERESSWRVCGPDTSAVMSAVGYYFASHIQAELGVPVGIIVCAWGGTSISCWMSRGQLLKTAAGTKYLNDYDALVGDKTDEQYREEMAAYNKEWEAWNARVLARKEKDPGVTWEVLNEECGLCPWPQPAGRTSPFRPAGLYSSMVERVSPYGIRGFLYYQGEEDEARYADYDFMMMSLITEWRSLWGDDGLPFLFVQLPMYIAKAEAVQGIDSRHWAAMRDQQMKVCRNMRNTGLAVLTDCGEFDNIHPLDKKTVGDRLALQARKKIYGEDVVADAPVADTVEFGGGVVAIRFHHTAGALSVKGEALQGFEVAGRDGVFYPAEGTAKGSTVHLQAAEVPEPAYVRYAWRNYCAAGLYGASGLPAAPFRTDHFPID